MIRLKKINSFTALEASKTPKSCLSKNKLKKSNKKVSFANPVLLKILTPNSITTNNKKMFNPNVTDKIPQTKQDFSPSNKIVINSIENQKTLRRPISRMIRISRRTLSIKEGRSYNKNLQKYPKTFYQKMRDNIEKMKINAERTIRVMKKNLRLLDHEVFLRVTNVTDINTLIKRGSKLKKENSKKNGNQINAEPLFKKQTEERNKKTQDNSGIRYKTIQFNEKEINNSSNKKKYYLGLQKIPIKPFYAIKIKPLDVPLFKGLEHNDKFYKNMYHIRFNEIKDKNTSQVSKKIYGAPYMLNLMNSYIKQPEIQLKSIYNKLKLLLDNINFFSHNYLNNKKFKHAFINMENPIKAHFNYKIEELCLLIMKLIPLILKEFYYSLSQLLYIHIPLLNEEKLKNPSNEIECLKYNIIFFQKIIDYFAGCVDIFNIIHKQIAEFKFSPKEFNSINNILDLARFYSTNLISMANTAIEKAKNDDIIIDNFEIGVNMKEKKIKEKETLFEKFHKRRRIHAISDKRKMDRIKSALNIGNKQGYNEFIVNLNKQKSRGNKTPSILNSFLIKDMMKYFKPEIKKQIVCEQVVERYQKKEIERLKFDPDNRRIDYGDNFNPEENEKTKVRDRDINPDKNK